MQITYLPVDKLHAGANPRSAFDDEELHALAASIEQDGVLDPIRVVANEDGFRIESGERRYRAALIAGLAEVPVIVAEGDATDEYVRAVVTNLQRADLNPVDEARAYKVLMDEHGLTVDGVVERLGVSRARVTMRLTLLELPTPIQQMYFDGLLRLDCRQVLANMTLVSPELAEHVAAVVAGKDEWGAVLAKSPMRVVRYAVSEAAKAGGKPRGWFMLPHAHDRAALGLSKKQQEAAKGFDREWAGWRPEYTYEDLDAAVKVGVAYTAEAPEGEDPSGVVVSPEWMASQFDVIYQRKVDQLKKRMEDDAKREAEAKANKLATGKAGAATSAASDKSDAEAAYRKAERAAQQDAKTAARNANLELGRKLFGELPKVTNKLDADAAQVIVGLILAGRQTDLFLGGLRYCLEQYQQVDDKGKVTYVTTVKDAAKHVVTFLSGLDGDEMLRRTLIILACARYADDGAVAQSDRRGGLREASTHVGSHETEVIGYVKSLEKLVKDYVPAASRGRDKPSRKVMAKFQKAWTESHQARGSEDAAQ